MDRDLEFQKAIEEYADKLDSIKSNEEYLSQAFYVENHDFESAEVAEKEIQELKEDLKSLEEKFGSEVAEKGKEFSDAASFVKTSDSFLSSGVRDYSEDKDTFEAEAKADEYKSFSKEEKAEAILKEYDTERFSDEALANAFNKTFNTDFNAEQVKEMREEIELNKLLDNNISKDTSSELSL